MIDTASSAPPVLRVLLRGVVDYAGLFPPAALSMAAAVEQYADHRASADAWALGRFVLPTARLPELEQEAGEFMPREASRSWALSALLSGDVEEDIGRIEQFNDRHRDARKGAVHVDTVELKVSAVRDVVHAAELLDRRFETYMEVPVAEDPAELIAAIARTHAKAKIRTGGTSADAFPTSAQIMRFMARCLAHNVGFKATAGLHHPWRSEYPLTYAPDAAKGTMYGFLNLLLAIAVLGAGAGEEHATALLENRDPEAVRFDREGVQATGVVLTVADVAKARDLMASFGSCSFEEPLSELRGLHIL